MSWSLTCPFPSAKDTNKNSSSWGVGFHRAPLPARFPVRMGASLRQDYSDQWPSMDQVLFGSQVPGLLLKKWQQGEPNGSIWEPATGKIPSMCTLRSIFHFVGELEHRLAQKKRPDYSIGWITENCQYLANSWWSNAGLTGDSGFMVHPTSPGLTEAVFPLQPLSNSHPWDTLLFCILQTKVTSIFPLAEDFRYMWTSKKFVKLRF